MKTLAAVVAFASGLVIAASTSYAQSHHTPNTVGGVIDDFHNGEANACALIKGVWYFAPQSSPQARGLLGYFLVGKPLAYFEVDFNDTIKCHGSNTSFRIYDLDGVQSQ